MVAVLTLELQRRGRDSGIMTMATTTMDNVKILAFGSAISMAVMMSAVTIARTSLIRGLVLIAIIGTSNVAYFILGLYINDKRRHR